MANTEENKERQSRLKDWQDFKNQEDFDDYRRSTSNPGLWKNSKGNFHRVPSRSSSTSENNSEELDIMKMKFVQNEMNRITTNKIR
jgi:hypothetical protein